MTGISGDTWVSRKGGSAWTDATSADRVEWPVASGQSNAVNLCASTAFAETATEEEHPEVEPCKAGMLPLGRIYGFRQHLK